MTQTVLPLSDAITLQRGFDLPTSQRQAGQYPVVASTGITSTHNEAKVNGPGVVIGRSGSIGGGQYIVEDFWPLNTTLWVKDFKGNNEQFIYYLMKSLDFSSFNAGAAVPTLNRNHLSTIKVWVPTRSEQDKIAGVLGTIDEKIELNRKMNETLEQMGQALFRHYFIANPETEKWATGKVSDLVTIYSGYAFKRTEFDPSGKYGLVTIKNVQDGNFVAECSDHLSEVPKIPDYIHLGTGDILLSLTGNVGRVCIVNGKDLLLNQRVAKLVGKGGRSSFAYFLFRQQVFKDKLISMSRGTAQLNLSPVETKNVKMKIPSSEVMNDFYKKAEPLFKRITANYDQIQTLTMLRDTLLPRLISGKIKL